MATSYTSLLGLALPVTGELSGTWGDTVNNSITSLLDTAVAGTTTVSADTTLTTTSGAANQARSAIIIASGHVANITITAPAQSKIYTVINASGTYTVTFRGVGPTTGVTLGVNEKAQLAWNGSDFVRIGGSGGAGVFSSITNSSLTSGRVVYSTTGGLETDSANLLFNGTTLTANTLNLTNALGTTYGGTGLTSFTSGGVVYASSGSALSTGSALTFSGTSLAVTGNFSSSNAGSENYYLSDGTTRTSLQHSSNALYYNVNDNSATNGVFIWRSTNAFSEFMRLTSTGLGIGTSSPAYKLDVRGASTDLFQVKSTGAYTFNRFQSSSRNWALSVSSSFDVYDETAAATRTSIDSSGNFGIGTSSPSTKLDVNGSGIMARVGGASGNNLLQAYTGSIGAGIWSGGQTRFYTTGAMTFSVNGTLTTSFPTGYTDAMTLDSSGNLTVGGTSALGTSSGRGNITINGTSSILSFGISGTLSGYVLHDGTDLWFNNATATGAQRFYTNGSERMRLDSSGNLGIGTSSPARKLDVNGTIRIADGQSVEWGGTSLYIAGTSNTFLFATSSTERMRLDSSGNLLVGTTTNYNSAGFAKTVSLYDASSVNISLTNASRQYQIGVTGTNFGVYDGTGSAWRLYLDSSGNLGIGTSSPTSYANYIYQTIQGTNGAGINLRNNAGTALSEIYQNSTGLVISSVSNLPMLFNTNNTERMRLDSSGNLIVGGTSTALGLVSVQGTGNYDAISAETSSATTTSYVTSVIRKTSTPASGPSTINFIGTQEFRAKTQSGTYKTPVQLLAGSITSSTNDNLWGTLQVNVNGYSTALGDFTQLQLLLGSGSSARFDVVCADGFGGTSTATQTLDTYFRPGQDNYSTLGQAARRWTTVYATTGTINTSDRNDKQDIEELSAAEQRVAARIKGLIRKFRFKDSVSVKGDNARIHFGVIAQDVQAAFTAEGLDASRYGLFCSDTFKAIDGKAVEKDENGQYPEGAVDYTRLGVRYEELLAFVISAI